MRQLLFAHGIPHAATAPARRGRASLPTSRKQASLPLYANHPAHTELVAKHILPIREKIIAVDYETETDVVTATPPMRWTLGLAAVGVAAGMLLATAWAPQSHTKAL